MKRKLVSNKAKTTGAYRELVCNFIPANCRMETLEGLEYIAVPVIMMTEGVHSGSDGPLLYTEEELGDIPSIWNQKPVVVYHPEMNGKGISACEVAVVDSQKVGTIMNAKYDKKSKALKAEAWIRKDRAEKIDDRILSALEENKMMEVSIGVFAEYDPEEGEWNGVRRELNRNLADVIAFFKFAKSGHIKRR